MLAIGAGVQTLTYQVTPPLGATTTVAFEGNATFTDSVGKSTSVTITRATVAATVQRGVPSITLHPQPLVVALGATATFNVTATSTTPLSYQWQRNGVSIPSATDALLTLNNVTADLVGEYTVTVSNSAGSVLSQTARLTVTSLATISIAANGPASEPSTSSSLTVTRTGATDSALTVSYSVGGTAINGTDYQSLSGSVTIPAGAATVSIVVAPHDDNLPESDETVSLTILPNSAYAVATANNATLMIRDDDSLPSGSRIYEAKRAIALNTPNVFAAAPARDNGLILFGNFSGAVSVGGQALAANGAASDMFAVKLNSTGQAVWVKQYGGANEEAIASCAQHPAGGWVVCGAFRNTGSFGGSSLVSSGKGDAFLARLDEDGNVLWVRRAGGSSIDYGKQVGVDRGGNCFLFGEFTTSTTFSGSGATLNAVGTRFDLFIAKYSASGDFQWAKSGGGPEYDSVYCGAVDLGGNAYIGGIFEKQAAFGAFSFTGAGNPSDSDGVIAKLNPTGDVIWAKQFGQRAGDISTDAINFVTPTSDGSCFVGGTYQLEMVVDSQALPTQKSSTAFTGKLDSGGKVQWLRAISIDSIIGAYSSVDRGLATADGGLLVCGQYRGKLTFGSTSYTNMNTEAYRFFGKYDANGNPQWAISADSSGFGYVHFLGSAAGERAAFTAQFYRPVSLPGIRPITATENDTVYVELGLPDSTPPTNVKLTRVGTTLRFEWPSGKLQSSRAITGPWSDVANASSPFTTTVREVAEFYRLCE